jgi:hypothetical protein
MTKISWSSSPSSRSSLKILTSQERKTNRTNSCCKQDISAAQLAHYPVCCYVLLGITSGAVQRDAATVFHSHCHRFQRRLEASPVATANRFERPIDDENLLEYRHPR